jgi:hypothetical protein
MPCEFPRAGVAARAAARRDEDERAPQSASAVDAGQLEHARGARQLGVAAACRGVAGGDDDDAPAGEAARPDADDVGQMAFAVDGPCVEALARDLQPGGPHLGGDVARERFIARAARPTRRIGLRELEQRGKGTRPLEGVRGERSGRRARRRPERERRDDSREHGRRERRAVDAEVEHRGEAR